MKMNTLEMAIKKADIRKLNEETQKCVEESIQSRIDKEKNHFITMIETALEPFCAVGFVLEKKWFGGHDYWVLYKDEKAILSCVLVYMRDEHWAIKVFEREWEGPHDQRLKNEISKNEDLEEVVSDIMADYL